MAELTTVSIGLGLVFSLGFSEFFSLAAGGLVVPGYLALFMTEPAALFATLLVSVVTSFWVSWISNTLLIFGKRRTVITLLSAFVLNAALRYSLIAPAQAANITGGMAMPELDPIGYLVPGLIALGIERQGMIRTFSVLGIVMALTRLAMLGLGVSFAGKGIVS
ncbi:MAG: poly-gamma-glutamate biosynthesis protein PgsC [Bdellovibrionota bacterium]